MRKFYIKHGLDTNCKDKCCYNSKKTELIGFIFYKITGNAFRIY